MMRYVDHTGELQEEGRAAIPTGSFESVEVDHGNSIVATAGSPTAATSQRDFLRASHQQRSQRPFHPADQRPHRIPSLQVARSHSMMDDEPRGMGAPGSETEEDNDSDDQTSVEPSFFIIPAREGGVPAASVTSSVGGSRGYKTRRNRRGGGSVVGDVESRMMSVESTSMTGPNACRPYRRDKLVKEIDTANARGGPGHASILKTLKNAGIMIYIVDSKVSGSVADVMDSVTNIIFHVCKETQSGVLGSGALRSGGKRLRMIEEHKKVLGLEDPEEDELFLCDRLCGPPGGKMEPKVAFHFESAGTQQRCLLYRDPDGRLFNLTLASHTTSIEGTWKALLQSFSVVQAVTLLIVLCRSFSCPREDNDVIANNFSPAYLTLVLGMVFSEEISLSWVNVAMSVRGFPSISAYKVVSKVESDWLRKALILCLAVASATSGTTQQICTLIGLSMACCIVLANLGARSWKYLGWKPTLASCYFGNCAGTTFSGIVEPVIAYAFAILTGICFPYLGHREVKVGGTVALESILRIAIVVVGLFVLSGYEEAQKLLVVGSENCSQDYVNMAVGGWWCLSLLACLLVVRRRKVAEFWPEFNEPLLKEDHTSPVGFTVPHLPDFPFDPTFAARETVSFNLQGEFVIGTLLALGVGGLICYMGIADVSYTFTGNAV